MPPRALVLGVKGQTTLVERVDGLGDASFSVCVPLRQGEKHVLAYGGQVLVRAMDCASVRVLPPQPYFAVWRARCARIGKALHHTASALGRRLHGA